MTALPASRAGGTAPRRNGPPERRALRGKAWALGLALLAGVPASVAPEISEFMARNQRTLADGYGEFADWIELHNPDAASISLVGWFLTDAPGDLTKWRLPELELPAGGFALVFASGRDGRDPVGFWHTNFRLDGDGEYLALVAPDGKTVVAEFGPGGTRFPPQHEDVSYGRRFRREAEWLLDAQAPGRLAVPTDDRWRFDWTGGAEPFADEGWSAVSGVLGYETSGGPGAGPRLYWPLDEILAGRTPDRAGRRHAQVVDAQIVAGAQGNALLFDGEDDYVTYAAPDFLRQPAALSVSLWFRRDVDHSGTGADTAHGVNNVLLAHSSSVENDNLELGSESGDLEFYFDTREQDGPSPSLRVAAGLREGQWYHVALTYDAGREPEVAVFFDGELLGEFDGWGGGFDVGDAPLSLGLARPDRELEGDFEGAIDEVALWDRALATSEVAALFGGTPPTGLGGFRPVIGSDIGSLLHGRNGSAYLRLPFDVTDPVAVSELELEMRYDAGFVAWLNGVEVAREQAPSPLTWEALATGERDDLAALRPVRIPLGPPAGRLREGRNMLAVQGLNSAADDDDFLLGVRLAAVRTLDGEVRFFTAPTPGAPNGPGVAGFVAPVLFSAQRGFYEAPFDLTLSSATPEAVIRFTTDGSRPTPGGGRVYTKPIRIATTTVVRAAAFRAGFAPAPAITHTYLFLAKVLQQPANPAGFPNTWTTQAADYEMDPAIVGDPVYGPRLPAALRSHPVLSLSLPVADLFDPATGIYANAQQKGDAWERSVSVEFFGYPDGRSVQVNAGLRMQGNASRAPSHPKHNFRLAFRRQYGAGSLHFPVFPGRDLAVFNNLVLRGQNGDSWIHPSANQRQRAQFIRDQWHRDLQEVMGHETLAQTHVHLYLNGLYWGFYHVIERAEAETMAEHFGGREEDYDVVIDYQRRAGEVEAVDGDLEAWNAMMATAQAAPADPRTFLDIQQYLDVTNFVDYLLLNFYSGNTDWDGSNWRSGRRRAPGAGFRFFAWDSERTIGDTGRPDVVTTTDITARNVANRPSSLHQTLTANPEYRLFFADRVQRQFFGNGPLTPARAAASWQARVDEFRLPLVAEAARWGDAHRPGNPYDPEDEWMAEVNRLMERYFPVRTGIVLEQLRQRGLYPDLAPPVIEPVGGKVAAGSRVQLSTLDDPAAEVFFTLDGSDPRTFGGAPGTGAILGREVILVRSGTLKARARQGAEWSALVEAVFTVDSAPDFGVVGAWGSGEPTGIRVAFSQPVDPASALTAGRYTVLDQAVAVTGLRLLDDYTVLLNTAPFGPPPLRLRVDGVSNRAGDQRLNVVEQPVDLGGFPVEDFTPPVFLQEPRDAVLVEGQSWTWQAALRGAPEELLRLRWFRDELPVGPAEPDWVVGLVGPEQDGWRVHAEGFLANGVFGRVRSRTATLRVLPDRLPPQLTEVVTRSGADRIRLRFSEPLDVVSATNAASYTLSTGPVRAASYDEDGREVTLFTDPLPPAGQLILQVAGVRDRSAAGNEVALTRIVSIEAPGYAERVLAAGPVRYWRFEETGGTTVASEVTGVDSPAQTAGQLVNGAALGQPGLLSGEPGARSVALDAALNQRINVPNGVDLNTAPGPVREKTLELWFRPTALPGVVGGVPEVATLYEQGGGTRALALYLYGTETAPTPKTAALVWFAFNNSGGDGPGDGWGPAFGNAPFVSTSVRLGEIHHVVGVMEGDATDALAGVLRLYVDGELAGEAGGVGQLYAHSGDVRIGYGNFRRHDNRGGDTGWFTGDLDELALYNRGLTAAEVGRHYEAGRLPAVRVGPLPRIQAALVDGYLVFDFTGVLQLAGSLDGPWSDVADSSPYVLGVPGASGPQMQFARTRADLAP